MTPHDEASTTPTDNRFLKAHANMMRDFIIAVHGIGFAPKNILFERSKKHRATQRALFDIIYLNDDETEEVVMFEAQTADEIKVISDAFVQYKHVLKEMLEDKGIEEVIKADTLLTPPNEQKLRKAISVSFGETLAEHAVPVPANCNKKAPLRQAASHIKAPQVKDPARVELARKASYRKWARQLQEVAKMK